MSRGIVLTCLAMLAFAGNSVICRLALKDQTIDPASFTAVRLASGALVLILMVSLFRRGKGRRSGGAWLSALALFAYAICFSYAYVKLEAASGALILFGFVQATMIAVALASGDRPGVFEWAGWLLAAAGLTLLLLPGAAVPSLSAGALMAVAGIAWGIYCIRGGGETDALLATTGNFVRSLVAVAVVTASLLTFHTSHLTDRGVLLAILSGALTSGIGYVLWYAALNFLTAMQAALVQLSVPAIAAAGGVLLLAEPLSARLVGCGLLIIGGICLALIGKFRYRTG